MKKKTLLTCLFALGAASMLTLGACGNNEPVNPDPDVPVNPDVPVGTIAWTGLETPKFHAGQNDSFDILAGVTAKAEDGRELTVEVKDDGGFDAAYPSDYYVTYAAKLGDKEVGTSERVISVMSSLEIVNGDFSDENVADSFLTEKEGVLPGGGNATRSVVDGALKVDITNSGNEHWNLQLKYTKPLDFIKDHTYKFTFRHKGNGHSVSGGAESAGLGMLYKGFMPTKTTSEWQTYSQYLDIKDDLTGVLPVVTMGYGYDFDRVNGEPHTIYIDDLKLEDVTGKVNTHGVTWENADDVELDGGLKAFEKLPAVTAKDKDGNPIDSSKIEVIGELPSKVYAGSAMQKSYRINHEDGTVSYLNRYVKVNKAVAIPWQTTNGEFDEGTEFWTTEGNDIEWKAENGEVSATFGAGLDVSANWRAQLWQGGITWEKGYTYYITYRVKASKVGMHLHAEVNNDAAWKHSHTDYIFEKANEYVDFKVGPFYMERDCKDWARLNNLLAYPENIGGTLTWDSILVSRVEGDFGDDVKRPNAYSLNNEDFKQGTEYWTFEDNRGIAPEEKTNTFTVENGEANIKFGDNITDGAPWEIQLFQAHPERGAFEVGKTYTVTWTVKGSKEGMKFNKEIFQTPSVEQIVTTEFADYTLDFTMPKDFNFQLGRVSMLLKHQANAGGTLTFKSIKVTEKVA